MKDYLKVLGWLFFSLLFPSLFLVMVLQLSSAERESFVNSGWFELRPIPERIFRRE